MSHHILMQTAQCIAASAANFIKAGRTIQGVRIEGRWDPVLAGQQPYDMATATTPHTVKLLESLSIEDRTAWLMDLFETDPRYECARHFTKQAIFHFPITFALYIENAWLDRMTKNW